MKIKRIAALLLAAAMLCSFAAMISCSDVADENNDGEESFAESQEATGKQTDEMFIKDTEKNTEKVTDKKPLGKEDREELLASTEIAPTVYDVSEIVTADKTTAGSFEAWRSEVVKPDRNNDDPTENAVIHSPFHTLKINGIDVPVYTARCTTGAHSFAWVDVTSAGDFLLEVELELSVAAEKCVLLPESRGGEIEMNVGSLKTDILGIGSYTFTFAPDSSDEVTDPTLAPLTLMVQIGRAHV